MEDRLQQVMGRLAGSGVEFGWPHRHQEGNSGESRAAVSAEGEDTVQQLQSRLEHMERRLTRGDTDPRDSWQTTSARHASTTQPVQLQAGRRQQPPWSQEATALGTRDPRRGHAGTEAPQQSNGNRRAAHARTHAGEAAEQGRVRQERGGDRRQHGEQRPRRAAAPAGGRHEEHAGASVQEQDALRWQARRNGGNPQWCYAFVWLRLLCGVAPTMLFCDER